MLSDGAKVDFLFHEPSRYRHGETHVAIHHSQTGALVATLVVTLAVSSDALYLSAADREVLQAWGSFLGSCLDMVKSLESAADGMRNASNAVKAMQAQAQRNSQRPVPSAPTSTASLADSVTSRLKAEALLATTQQIYDYQYQVRPVLLPSLSAGPIPIPDPDPGP